MDDAKFPTVSDAAIKHKVYAHVGLLGNYIYYGRTISLSLCNFRASVLLSPSNELVITPHLVHDLVHFNFLNHPVVGKPGPTVKRISGLSILDNDAVNLVSILMTTMLTSMARVHIF